MEPENDIVTRGNRAGEVRQDGLWFLEESLDQINRGIQDTFDFEQMSHVLDAVLSVFVCDRAWIVYPCDPESRIWRTVAERTRPEFADSVSLHLDLPMDTEAAQVHRIVKASKAAVRFGPGANNPLPSAIVERFGVQSRMCAAVYPKIGKPHMFGIDQCTSARNWIEQEQSLFEATGQRLATLLTSLSLSRDLQESKARLEEAQRVAHVGHWEWDLETDVVVWSDETYRIFGLRPQERPMDLATVRAMVHPEDRDSLYRGVDEDLVAGVRPDAEFRIVRPSGEVRTVHALTSRRWSATPGDSERTHRDSPINCSVPSRTSPTGSALRKPYSEPAHFREGQRLAHMGSWTSNGSVCQWSEELFEIYGVDPRNGVPTTEEFLAIMHPQDRALMADAIKMMLDLKRGFDVTTRIVRFGSETRHVRSVGIPVLEKSSKAFSVSVSTLPSRSC